MLREFYDFTKPCDVAPFRHRPTLSRVVEFDSDGKSVIVVKDLSLIDNPLDVMSYDDFTISNLLKNGVELKPIVKYFGNGLGIDDAVIDDFNDRLDSINNELFNLNS